MGRGRRRTWEVTSGPVPRISVPGSMPLERGSPCSAHGCVMNERVQRWSDRWDRTLEVVRAPRVRIEVSGDETARADFRVFTARHPRLKVVAAKRWGVALLAIPDSFEEYLNGGSRHRRRKRNRAEKAGFRYAVVPPLEHLDEILEVNRSAPSRQGRPMSDRYVDRELVLREHEHDAEMHAILDPAGHVRAYAITHDLGDVVAFSKLMGHADDLDAGVMYLLVSEIVRRCVVSRQETRLPTWLMYDTYWGAKAGLATFKTRLGFTPYTVRWVWAGPEPSAEPVTGVDAHGSVRSGDGRGP